MSTLFNAYHRHLVLLFVVGFTWGYVAKVFMGAFAYIGWNDPQVIDIFTVIDLNTLHPTQLEIPVNPQ